MTAEIVNLRLVRKRRARAQAESDAAQSRARHGRTKGEKRREAIETEQATADLARKKLDPQT